MATVHLVRRLSLLQGALTQMHGRTPFLALDCCERGKKKNKKTWRRCTDQPFMRRLYAAVFGPAGGICLYECLVAYEIAEAGLYVNECG